MICISIENYSLRFCPVNNKMNEQFPKYPSTSLTHISLDFRFQMSNFLLTPYKFLWMQILFRSANPERDWPMISFNWLDLTNPPHLYTARVILLLSPSSRHCLSYLRTAVCSPLQSCQTNVRPQNQRRHKNLRLENKGFWAWILNFVQIFRQFWCTLDRVLYVFARPG